MIQQAQLAEMLSQCTCDVASCEMEDVARCACEVGEVVYESAHTGEKAGVAEPAVGRKGVALGRSAHLAEFTLLL